MILLSSLLGPAKPPVASQEDVSSAGGLFRLVEYGGTLMAEAEGGSGAPSIPIAENERCLICLSDYEAAEELRQLTSCKHLYHKDCIDEVSCTPDPDGLVKQLLTSTIVVDNRAKFMSSLQRSGSL